MTSITEKNNKWQKYILLRVDFVWIWFLFSFQLFYKSYKLIKKKNIGRETYLLFR